MTRQKMMHQRTKLKEVGVPAGRRDGGSAGKLNTVNMTAWVHKECNGIEEEAITKLQEAWDSKGSVGMSRRPLGPTQVEVTSFNAVSTYS